MYLIARQGQTENCLFGDVVFSTYEEALAAANLQSLSMNRNYVVIEV